MSYCPYSEEELQKWDSVSNPMGEACSDCTEYDCEHNPNPDPSEPDFNEMELHLEENKLEPRKEEIA